MSEYQSEIESESEWESSSSFSDCEGDHDRRIQFHGIKSTKLSNYILERNWKNAKNRMEMYPHEVSTEITLQCFRGGNCLGLPLHLACTMRPLPPASFLHFLIEFFPDAALSYEKQWRMLPLHFACMPISKQDTKFYHIDECEIINRHIAAIQYLIKANPIAVKSRESFHGKLPIHLATNAYATGPSYPQVVKILAQFYPRSIHIKDNCGETPIAISRRIQQWRQFCIKEEHNYFSSNCFREKNQLGFETEMIISLMFDQAFFLILQERQERMLIESETRNREGKKEHMEPHVDNVKRDKKNVDPDNKNMEPIRENLAQSNENIVREENNLEHAKENIRNGHPTCKHPVPANRTNDNSKQSTLKINDDKKNMYLSHPVIVNTTNIQLPQAKISENTNNIRSIQPIVINNTYTNTLIRKPFDDNNSKHLIQPVLTNTTNIALEKKVTFRVCGEALKKKPVRRSCVTQRNTNPFFEVSLGHGKSTENRIWAKVYRSHPIMNDRDPFWDRVSFDVDSNYEDDTPVQISIMNCDLRGIHKLIGNFETTLGTLCECSNSSIQFKLKRTGKQDGKAGTVTVTCLSNPVM